MGMSLKIKFLLDINNKNGRLFKILNKKESNFYLSKINKNMESKWCLATNKAIMNRYYKKDMIKIYMDCLEIKKINWTNKIII